MTNFRHLFMLTALGAMTLTAAQAKSIYVSCSTPAALEIRDGGVEGELVEVTYSGQMITLNGEEVYVGLKDGVEDKILSRVAYNSYTAAGIIDGCYSIIPVADLNDNSYLNIDLSDIKILNLIVPDPELVVVKDGMYGNTFNVVAGLNALKVGQYAGIYVAVKDTNAWKMTSFRSTVTGTSYNVDSFTAASVYASNVNGGDTFEYTLIPASELVLPKFTVIVDDPNKISLSQRSGNITGLVANEPNEVEITTGSTVDLTLRPANSSEPLFKVTLNDAPLTDSYGYYYIYNVKNGDVLNIQANYPDYDCTVSLASNPAENAAFITNVTVDGAKIENWTEPFVVKAGKTLHLDLDKDLYTYKNITINGASYSGYVYNSADIRVTDNSVIEVFSEKIPVLTATVNVTDPAGVTCQLAYSKILSLEEGENTIEFTSSSNSLRIMKNAGYILNKIETYNPATSSTQSYSTSSDAYIYLSEGMIVTIDVEPMVKDCTAVLYTSHDFDHSDFSSVQFYNAAERGNYQIHKQGYNFVEFNHTQLEHYLMSYNTGNSPVMTYVYLNGERKESPAPTGHYYDLNLNHGDVLKTYFFNEPAEVAAIFDVDDDCDVTIRKNLIQDVDLTEDDAIYDLEGTLVQIASNTEEGIAVCVMDLDMAGFMLDDDDDDPGMGIDPVQNFVDADDNGVYNVTLTGSHYIVVRPANLITVGVKGLAADQLGNDIFTLTGVRVAKNASRADLEKLPAGIYVCAGKKIVVR